MKLSFPIATLLLAFISCTSSDSEAPMPGPPSETMYFPPLQSAVWEAKSIADMSWNEMQVEPLLNFLEAKHTKSFMVLVNGRIVLEAYFNGHSASTGWYWASAGKTLTATTAGIAEEQGLIELNSKVSII
jgi:CubicO group peptidase (beta-lactamase class C family)